MNNAQRQRSEASHRGALTKAKGRLAATLEANKAMEEELELERDNTAALRHRKERMQETIDEKDSMLGAEREHSGKLEAEVKSLNELKDVAFRVNMGLQDTIYNLAVAAAKNSTLAVLCAEKGAE